LGALDVETVVQNAVEDSLSDQFIVVGFGRDLEGPGAEELAAATACLVLGVVDVGVGYLAKGQRVDTTVEAAFAAAGLAAGGTGMGLGGASDDANVGQDHGLCSSGKRR
jgi:hypothetical protein